MVMHTLMDIWLAGARMPFMVEHPDSKQKVVIKSYYWPKKFFEGEMNGVAIALTPNWQLWRFVREA
jgi:hypothetical protein